MTLHQSGDNVVFTRSTSEASGSFVCMGNLPFGTQLAGRTILPRMIVPDAVRQEILRELAAIAQEAVDLYKKTTAGWSFQPQFASKLGLQSQPAGSQSASVSNDVRITVGVVENGEQVADKGYTTAEIYTFVDQGVAPHVIEARTKPMMMFLPEYRARTTPHVLSSGESERGGDLVGARSVYQGIEARHFSDDIADIMQEEINKRIPDAIQRGLNKAIVQ